MNKVLILDKDQKIKEFKIIQTIHKNKAKGQFIISTEAGEAFLKYYFKNDKTLSFMMHNEIDKISKLSNYKFVPKVISSGYDNFCYIMEERVKGENLDKHKFNNETDTINFIMKLLEIICTIHDNNIIHGDLKPSNIIIDEIGEIKIVDFEIARYVDQDDDILKNYGSIIYASPEQIKKQKLTFKSDIYQVGLIIKKLLYGITGFEKLTYSEIASKKHTCNYTLDELFKIKEEEQLLYIINKAICNDEDLRYNNVGEMIEELSKLWGVRI